MKITIKNKSDDAVSYQSKALRLEVPAGTDSVHEIPEGCFEDLKFRLTGINPMITVEKGEKAAEPAPKKAAEPAPKAAQKKQSGDTTNDPVEA